MFLTFFRWNIFFNFIAKSEIKILQIDLASNMEVLLIEFEDDTLDAEVIASMAVTQSHFDESMSSLELYQDKEEISNTIDEVPRLIADADSTQYAVIKNIYQ